MNWEPNKYLAALLGFCAMPLGMLYVVRPMLSAAYLVGALVFSILDFVFLHRMLPPAASMLLLFVWPVACSYHAYRIAEEGRELAIKPWYAKWHGLAVCFALLLALFGGFRAFLFEPFRIPSASMLPSVKPGASLLVQKWAYGNYEAYGIRIARAGISEQLNRGDIVVFEHPANRSLKFVSRVVGLPGDSVAYQNKLLSLNGRPVQRQALADYLDVSGLYSSRRFTEKLDHAEYEVIINDEAPAGISPDSFPLSDKCHYDESGVSCSVPAGHYFVLSDNRDAARDSRAWGFVPAENVVGKAIYVSR